MTMPDIKIFVKSIDKMFLPKDIIYIDFEDKIVSVRGCGQSDCTTCDDQYKWEECEFVLGGRRVK